MDTLKIIMTYVVALVLIVLFCFGIYGGLCSFVERTTNTKVAETSPIVEFLNSSIGCERVENIIKWQRNEPRLKPIIAKAIEDERITQEEYFAIRNKHLGILRAKQMEELRDKL